MTPNQIDSLTNEASYFEKITDSLGYLNIFFVVAAALITIATFYSSNRLAKAKDKIAELKIADANAKAAKAIEVTEVAKVKQTELAIEISEARKKQAEAEEKQALAQLALLELQKRLTPRSLTDNQKGTLVKILGAGPKGLVVIDYAIGDSEAAAYAEELANVFRNAGWKVDGAGPILIPTLPKQFTEKILINVDRKNANSSKVASLLRSFEQAGLPVSKVVVDKELGETIEMYVGNRL